MSTLLLTESDVSSAIISLAEKIMEAHSLPSLKNCAFIGILPHGVPIAKRIAHYIHKTHQITIPVGQLDVSLYRDNLTINQPYVSLQETDIPFSTKNKTLILINDIFFEGKGVRAALNTLIDFDSPLRIEVGVILDRGHRKLPIHPDYVVQKIETNDSDSIETKLFEINGEDSITLNHVLSSTQKV